MPSHHTSLNKSYRLSERFEIQDVCHGLWYRFPPHGNAMSNHQMAIATDHTLGISCSKPVAGLAKMKAGQLKM